MNLAKFDEWSQLSTNCVDSVLAKLFFPQIRLRGVDAADQVLLLLRFLKGSMNSLYRNSSDYNIDKSAGRLLFHISPLYNRRCPEVRNLLGQRTRAMGLGRLIHVR